MSMKPNMLWNGLNTKFGFQKKREIVNIANGINMFEVQATEPVNLGLNQPSTHQKRFHPPKKVLH